MKVSKHFITLTLYDERQSDGDRVSINMNGKTVIKDYTVTKKPKNIKIRVDPNIDVNQLTFIAENLGNIPPNTGYHQNQKWQQNEDVSHVRYSGKK